MKKMLFCSLLLMSAVASAAFVATPATKIKSFKVYNTEAVASDVVFIVDNPIPGCESGFWLAKSDAGYQSNYIALVAAFHAKTPVVIAAHNHLIWPGYGQFCKLYSIESL
jgi:hypothetical protein